MDLPIPRGAAIAVGAESGLISEREKAYSIGVVGIDEIEYGFADGIGVARPATSAAHEERRAFDHRHERERRRARGMASGLGESVFQYVQVPAVDVVQQ